MIQTPSAYRVFLFPADLIQLAAGPDGAKNHSGESPPPDSDPLKRVEFEKIPPTSQDNSVQVRTAASSSMNAVSRDIPHHGAISCVPIFA